MVTARYRAGKRGAQTAPQWNGTHALFFRADLTRPMTVRDMHGERRLQRAGLFLYLMWACAATWPLVAHLGVVLPGWPGDTYQLLWGLDATWRSILAGTPLWTKEVAAPVGANLLHSLTGPFLALLAGPFWWWDPERGLVLFAGLLPIASLVVAAAGMRALVQRLTGNTVAAWWAGLLFASAPAMLSLAGSATQWHASGAALLPWALLALLRVQAAPRAWAPVCALSALAWIAFFTDYYSTFMLVVLVGVVGALTFRREHRRPLVRGLLLNGGLVLVAVAVLPPFDPSDLRPGSDYYWTRCAIALRDLFVPGPLPEQVAAMTVRPLLLPLATYATDWGPDPSSYYVGIGVLALAVSALWRGTRWQFACFVAFVLLALLAAGTKLAWTRDGLVLAEGPWTPLWWVMQIPWLRAFERVRTFVVGAMVPLVTLAGVGLARFRARIICVLAAVVYVVEYAQFGIATTEPKVPAVYRELASRPRRTLLELPSGITESTRGLGLNYDHQDNNPAMFWQVVHRKPRVACYLSRVPWSTYQWFFNTPVIGDLLIFTQTEGQEEWNGRTVKHLPRYSPETVDQFIAALDLGYIVFRPGKRRALYEEEVGAVLGARVVQRETIDGYDLWTIAPITARAAL